MLSPTSFISPNPPPRWDRVAKEMQNQLEQVNVLSPTSLISPNPPPQWDRVVKEMQNQLVPAQHTTLQFINLQYADVPFEPRRRSLAVYSKIESKEY